MSTATKRLYPVAVRDWIDRHLHPVCWKGDEATIHCPLPGHSDANASAGAHAVKAAWKCHGCEEGGKLSDLAARVGLPAPPLQQVAPPADPSRLVHRYTSHDDAPLLEVVRYRNASGRRRTAIRHRPEWHPTLTPRRPPNENGWSWCYPDIGGGLLFRAKELSESPPNKLVVVGRG